jgi:plastocyanin
MTTGTSFYTAAGSSITTLNAAPNTPVTWTNDSGVLHDVTFDTPSAALAVGNGSSGNIPAHSTGSNQRQFAVIGNYPFHCTIHGTVMHGTVNVQ